MNKLSAEKRRQILYVAIGAAALVGALWFFAIGGELDRIYDLDEKNGQAREKLYQNDLWITKAKKVQPEVEHAKLKLEALETGMAPANKLEWRQWLRTQLYFVQTNYHDQVILSEITLDPGECNVELLPRFPYQAVRFRVPVTAYFQDFGKFLADLENQFPYLRIENLSLRPAVSPLSLAGAAPGAILPGTDTAADAARADKPQKLSIQMHVIALVKPNSPP